MFFPPKKAPASFTKQNSGSSSVSSLQSQQKRIIAAKSVATDPVVKAGLERREQLVTRQLMREKTAQE